MLLKKCNIILFLAVVLFLAGAVECTAASDQQEDIWADEPNRERPQRFELSEDGIEWLMNRIAEEQPERAKELSALRKENPEQFRKEIGQILRQRFGRNDQQDRPGQGPPAGGRMTRGGWRSQEPPMGPIPPDMMPMPDDAGRPDMPPCFDMAPGPEGPEGPEDAEGPGARLGQGRMQARHRLYLQWLEKNYPDEAQEISELWEKNPEMCTRRINLSRKHYGRIMEAAEENPELGEVLREDLELRQHQDELLKILKSAQGQERQEMEKELQKVVAARFDIIVRKKQLQYKGLLKKIEQLQKEVHQRETEVEKLIEKKDQAVQERIEQLIGKTERIDWD